MKDETESEKLEAELKEKVESKESVDVNKGLLNSNLSASDAFNQHTFERNTAKNSKTF